MRYMNRGRITAVLLAACMMITTGCGEAERERQEAPEADRTEETVCYYQARQIDTPIHAQGFSGWTTGSNMTENGLYYLFDPLYGLDRSPKLYRVPLEKLYHEDVLSGNYAAVQPVQLTDELPLPENMTEMKNEWLAIEYCERFFQGENGELYYLTFNPDDKKRRLYRVDAEGREISTTDVTEVLQDMPHVEEITEGYLENSSCAADSQGRVCLTDPGQTQLWILDAQGKLHMQLPLPEDMSQLAFWQDGKIYLVTGQGDSSQIKRLDCESGSMETVMDMPQTVGGGALVPTSGSGNGGETDGESGCRLLYRDYRGLYACDPGQGSAECLVNWDEAGVSGKNILQAR
ncbi:MAG: hypothetical protein K2L18_05355, partial [Acetatifactor sp.]|nr:hypothetical protein [Acetatifactor sp.]